MVFWGIVRTRGQEGTGRGKLSKVVMKLGSEYPQGVRSRKATLLLDGMF